MKKLLNIIAVMLTVFIFTGCSYNSEDNVELDYCKDIYKSLNKVSSSFECISIRSICYDKNEDVVEFRFDLKSKREVDEKKDIDDYIPIRKKVIEYLSQNPQNELNNQKIELVFQFQAGEVHSIYNYSFAKKGLYNDFPFCNSIPIYASNYKDFTDAIYLSMKIENTNDLQVLENFNKLEYLILDGIDISDNDKAYIRNTLPDCKVYYNGELISNENNKA
ncbi:MAG: hypothetical protein K5979_08795 [Ruminococcus sp.]|nr:hypothetical protein [Ruminococcus sp.]